MRSILRKSAKTLAVLLWIVKGLLLVLAVGAAVLWPVSRGRVMGVQAERYRAGPALGEWRRYAAGCWDGRVVFARIWSDARGGRRLAEIRAEVQSGGQSWRSRQWSDAVPWNERYWPSRWGPLRWDISDGKDPDSPYNSHRVAVPLWLLSLAAGPWPLASFALLIRRRRKRRRLARVGCCLHCGYDLRATAEANGPLLARCPECGAGSADLPPIKD